MLEKPQGDRTDRVAQIAVAGGSGIHTRIAGGEQRIKPAAQQGEPAEGMPEAHSAQPPAAAEQLLVAQAHGHHGRTIAPAEDQEDQPCPRPDPLAASGDHQDRQ